ncbi:MAG: hypothetical protein LBD06_07365 [Candidatus Accumulibacter sp.]|jgi:hypothetical protein|nr:hypothetical protein [Accumulibacter sp.]
MSFGSRDLAGLRATLLAVALMLVSGGLAILSSRDRIVTARAAFSAARAERNEIDGKLRRMRGEEHEIRWKATLFKRLEERGVVGEERRLEWAELLEDIRDQYRLIEVRYEFAPPRALGGDQAGRFGPHASAMRLRAPLLHEEDLIRLLDELRRRARALIRVRYCDVTRRKGVDDALQGSLRADCLIDWITLREAGKDKGGAE